MPSRLPTITAPAGRLDSYIEHFPRDHQFASWDYRYGRVKPKNKRTFNAYRRRLRTRPPPLPQADPWWYLVSKWLKRGANWLMKKVQVRLDEEEFPMSGALPVEEHMVESECGSMRYTVWSSVEASEIELGLV
jgi:hypothetical protein